MQRTDLVEHFATGIDGLDLSRPLADADAAELRRLFAERLVLVFRDQQLSGEQQVAFMANFGDVVDEGGDGKRYVYVSNAREDGVLKLGRQLLFHSDNGFTPDPLDVIALYGAAIEGEVAPTRFVNTERTASLLPPDLRGELAGADALNLSGFAGGWYRYRDADHAPHHPRAAHPVLRRNERNGHVALFVSHQQTDRIIDWDRRHSEETLQELFDLQYRPDNIYEHHWRQGDLVLWDNISVQHGRPALGAGTGERTLQRTAAVVGGAESQRAWTADTLASEVTHRRVRA